MKQKEFVKQAIVSSTTDGNIDSDQVTNLVTGGLMSGECEHSKGFEDEKKARAYAKAVISNYMKKDHDLNGGVKYEPATRRGPIIKDQKLRDLKSALKALEANNADSSLIGKVNEAINTRTAELEADKAKKNLPSLEDALRTLETLGITA